MDIEDTREAGDLNPLLAEKGASRGSEGTVDCFMKLATQISPLLNLSSEINFFLKKV